MPSSSTFERRELGRSELWPAEQGGLAGVLPSRRGWRAAEQTGLACCRAEGAGVLPSRRGWRAGVLLRLLCAGLLCGAYS